MLHADLEANKPATLLTSQAGQPRGKPVTLALSSDTSSDHPEEWLAVAYDLGEGQGGWVVDIHHVGDLMQGSGQSRWSKALRHDVRFLRWSKRGPSRLLIAGQAELSLLRENQELSPSHQPGGRVGAADWCPSEEDLLVVSYLGEGE